MRKKGFTLIELLVVIAIIAMLLAILMPALSKVKKIAMRVICGTNLKGLGTAQAVYAQDYDDEYVVQGGGSELTWNFGTGGWDEPSRAWKNTTGDISIGASLYLLVREADVSPKSFVCPSGDEEEFDGMNTGNHDIVELWDFGVPKTNGGGMGPTNCVSYSYHMPYSAGQENATSTGGAGKYAADGTRSAAFAMMADKNPYFDENLTNGGATPENWEEFAQRIFTPADGDWGNIENWKIKRANAQPHERDSQNVLFADGHSSNERRTDVGIKYDQIYGRWLNNGATEEDRRKGLQPANLTTDCAPAGSDDSVLVNDAFNMTIQ